MEGRRAEGWALRPLAAPLRGSPGGLLRPGYRTVRRLLVAGDLLVRRCGVSGGFGEGIAAEQEDLGVLDQAVGDRGGDGRVEQNVAPVGEWSVRRNDAGLLAAVAGRDDLIEQIRGLLVEGEIPKLVNDQ